MIKMHTSFINSEQSRIIEVEMAIGDPNYGISSFHANTFEKFIAHFEPK